MLKFLKYELKANMKVMIAICIILFFGIFSYVFLINQMETSSIYLTGTLITGFLVIMGGSFIAYFVNIINNFKKELYDDRGYLTFSLPISGKVIIGAKVLHAAIFSTLVLISVILSGFLSVAIIFDEKVVELLFDFLRGFKICSVLFHLFMLYISGSLFILCMYFSIYASKFYIFNKKIGSFWFLLFLGLTIAIDLIAKFISSVSPLFINTDTLEIILFSNEDFIGSVFGVNIVQSALGFSSVNLMGLLFNIIVTIFMFFFVSNLVEKNPNL